MLQQCHLTHLVEGHHGLPCQRLGHECLASARVTLQQYTLGGTGPQLAERLGVLQELHHLRQMCKRSDEIVRTRRYTLMTVMRTGC